MSSEHSPAEVSIRAQGLGKRYRIGARRERYRTLRDALAGAVTRPWQRAARLLRGGGASGGSEAELWALKDLSFEVHPGEVLGVIGRNGAGKSTLLKLLSRITEPTCGRAEIHGRVGSLLEVGTGFHPELTGRENIYLNGAILGMKREEIRRKLDAIIAFAEIETFVDTAVKHYSSGMYLRLAFAVAAHLEPEILLVDEVLAVGDLSFQKKCLGQLDRVARAGRTVLLVSHQLNQIRRLSHRCLWLDGGRLRAEGPPARVVAEYEAAMATAGDDSEADRPEAGKARFLSWRLEGSAAGAEPHTLEGWGELCLRLRLSVHRPLRGCHHGINLTDAEGRVLWGWATSGVSFEPGLYELSYRLPSLPLRPGSYPLLTSLYDETGLVDLWYWTPQLIVATDPVTHPDDRWAGILNVPCEFTAEAVEPEVA